MPKGKQTILPGNSDGFQAERSAACEIAQEWWHPSRRLFNFPICWPLQPSHSGEVRLQTEVQLRGAQTRNR